MAIRVIAEGIARIEHKIDAIIRHLKVPTKPLHFIGDPCPTCLKQIDYQIDPFLNVVVRKCGCSTGKVPSTIPLLPIGASNGDSSSVRQKETSGGYTSEDSAGGPASTTGPGKLR